MGHTFIDLFAGIGGIRLGLEAAGMRCVFSSEKDAAAAETYRANFGDAPAGDIMEVDPADVPDHDLLAGGFPCFAAGTLVLAESGYVPIETVSVGDRVLTHRGRWRRVTAVMKRDGAKLRRVKAQGADVVTTDEHPFYAKHRRYLHPYDPETKTQSTVREFTSPAWIKASALTRDHYVSQVLPPVRKDSYTAEFWWLVGRYLADGWRVRRKGRVNAGRTVICCAHAEADELRERIASAGFRATSAPERTVVKFHITVNSLYRFLEPFGHLAHAKTLPGFALSLSAAKSKALLDGYLSGDGSDCGSGRRATTVSQRLAFGMGLLAQRTGRVASIRSYRAAASKKIEGRSVRQREMWFVTIPGRNRSGFIEDGLGWKLVRESSRCGTGTVYNMAVEEDESYMANGAVVHNCQPFSICGRHGGLKDSRGTLFREILRLAEAKGTPALLLENVKHLEHHDGGDTLRTILRELGEHSYTVSWRVLNARDFGVPQNRERIILVCDRAGRGFDFSALRTGRADTMRSVLQARGDFEFLDPSEYTLVEQGGPTKSGLVFAGHRNKAIRKAGVRPGTEHLSRVHKQPNRIYDSSGVHPTLAAGESSGRYFILHNGRVRRLTVKECYALMGFPGTFRPTGAPTSQYRQIGNSVCVPMFAELGREVRRQLLD